MTKKIKVAIAGIGNCASALVQGIQIINPVLMVKKLRTIHQTPVIKNLKKTLL